MLMSFACCRSHIVEGSCACTLTSFDLNFDCQTVLVERITTSKRTAVLWDYGDPSQFRFVQVQPMNIGQASRTGGVNPADITALLIHLEIQRRQQSSKVESERVLTHTF